ncbi:hypothetical protein PsorP6_007461 [Peronosclerospora sorghi]|uniref:Uncharacterized protein n=1 Tax=Peronosclerospora sorghi TaxID=230839 RepID=A0ACC0WBN7_9STRA|nr:hypothetical protein PsorP6_007461 [Peronosclerospora sorghi]
MVKAILDQTIKDQIISKRTKRIRALLDDDDDEIVYLQLTSMAAEILASRTAEPRMHVGSTIGRRNIKRGRIDIFDSSTTTLPKTHLP